ncbi:MAG: hypothetical protein KAT75_00610 [Dehalococcoidia bacterium]|nr:hypothetical protein [Dehalococcoidia bacterium]
MSKYRSALLLAAVDLGAAGTKVIDIDTEAVISAIDIKFRITKVLDYMTSGVPGNITKIEIVDGAKVLYSLTGYECQALGYYNRPNRQLEHGQELAANSEEAHFPIDFGRWLWDDQLAFDPKRFTNPQLKLTFDENISDTSAEENECEATAFLFDEKQVSPVGFLAGIEHYSYTCGADNSFETLLLPDDRMIRQILLRAYQDAYDPWYQIDEARLDENTLDKIVFDFTSLENYARMMKSVWQPIQTGYVLKGNTAGEIYYMPGTDYWSSLVVSPRGTTTSLQATVDGGRGGKHTLYSSSDGAELNAIHTGWLPWHTYQFPMGDPKDLEDWYDPKGKKPRLRLRASTGATSGTGEVVLEELVRY